MRYNGSIRFDFKEIYGCTHGLSAIIHIGARFKDSDLWLAIWPVAYWPENFL